MPAFLSHIAILLAIAVAGAGLVALHNAGRQEKAPLLRAAGLVWLLGGIVVSACISYYWVHYQVQGDLDRAWDSAAVHAWGGAERRRSGRPMGGMHHGAMHGGDATRGMQGHRSGMMGGMQGAGPGMSDGMRIPDAARPEERAPADDGDDASGTAGGQP